MYKIRVKTNERVKVKTVFTSLSEERRGDFGSRDKSRGTLLMLSIIIG